MKKYKVLLIGNNNATKNDFFNRMNDVFFVLSSSMRYDDIINHLDFFSPEIIVYCVSDKMREDWSSITAYRQRIEEDEIVTVVVGSKESCENFKRVSINIGDLVLRQPLTASVIKERIVEHMENLAQEKEEKRLQQEAHAKEEERLQREAHAKEEERLQQEAHAKEEERLQQEAHAKEEKRLQQEIPAQEEEKKRRKHVLVIDDDSLMLKLIKEHLHEKYDVATAISGKIAYKFLESKKTDLILLDYEMPAENGPEVLAKIRENKKLAEVPIIFLTGISEKEKIAQALKLKPQGYLLKPIEKDILLETIEKYIG